MCCRVCSRVGGVCGGRLRGRGVLSGSGHLAVRLTRAAGASPPSADLRVVHGRGTRKQLLPPLTGDVGPGE